MLHASLAGMENACVYCWGKAMLGPSSVNHDAAWGLLAAPVSVLMSKRMYGYPTHIHCPLPERPRYRYTIAPGITLLIYSSVMHTAMPSTAAVQGSPFKQAAATAAETDPADRPYPSANASSIRIPSTASTAVNTEDDATLLNARAGPSPLASSSSSTATAVAGVNDGAGNPHQPNGGGTPPQLNPASLDTSASTSSAAAAATALLFATPKGRGGGGAHGPALVVFSGGTAFNVVAGEGEWGGGTV